MEESSITHSPKKQPPRTMGQYAIQKQTQGSAFYYSYCVLFFFFSCLVAIFLFFLSFREKYKLSIPARFLLYKNKLPPFKDLPIIWFHACSFGEVRSLEPLIRHFENTHEILITTVTNTGYQIAQKLYPKAHIRFIPCEFLMGFWLQHLPSDKLQKLIVIEAEIWLALFYCAKQHGAKTFLLSARLSDRSFPKYQKFSFFYKKVFLFIDKILCQSQKDVERFILLGSSVNQTLALGNLKTLNTPKITQNYTKPHKPLFIAASTHSKEEVLLLKAFLSAFKKEEQKPILAFVPRHPERFLTVRDELQEILNPLHKNIILASTQGIQRAITDNEGYIVIDCLGELINLYAIATLVMLGGSFVENIGGHNPLEPSYFKTKLISGPFIFNQTSLFALVDNAIICPPKDLPNTLANYEKIPQSHWQTTMSLQKVLEEIQ